MTEQMFLQRKDDQGRQLIRQTNGRLGATINDPDIYRVDPQTGVATFYNPDTGKPFTGDDPRAQAKLWVDGYNDELRDTFNKFVEHNRAQLEEQAAPVINLIKFAPTYEALDPVTQKMFDALVEDYEVYDDKGKHIGYSVDLDKALAQVRRQIGAIKASQPPAEPKPPTGPAVDMPTMAGGGVPEGEPKSVAEALERLQDADLAKLKK